MRQAITWEQSMMRMQDANLDISCPNLEVPKSLTMTNNSALAAQMLFMNSLRKLENCMEEADASEKGWRCPMIKISQVIAPCKVPLLCDTFPDYPNANIYVFYNSNQLFPCHDYVCCQACKYFLLLQLIATTNNIYNTISVPLC